MLLKAISYIFLLGKFLKQPRNNACMDFFDYFHIDSSERCFYNPDIVSEVPDLIMRHIGFYERYKTITEDGYIITMFRIPNPNPKGVILLQHPLVTDSIIWLGQSDQSLAYLFWRNGYDVWLGNNRGTYYSNEHINLTINDYEFWDYSFHEIGLYDLKAEIDLIKEKTNSTDIIYLGHSMSTTTALIYASLREEEAKNSVKIFIQISPIAYWDNLKFSNWLMAYSAQILEEINTPLKIGSVAHHNNLIIKLCRNIAFHLPFKKYMTNIFSLVGGTTPNEFDPYFINFFFSHQPRGFSWKILYHYFQQVVADGRFQMYDYGEDKNKQIYGYEQPPDYPLRNIMTPMYIIYSENDDMSTRKDVELLYRYLPAATKIHGKLKINGLNHFDFHYGKSRKHRVYDKIFDLLDKL